MHAARSAQGAVYRVIGADREERGFHPSAWRLDALCARHLNSIYKASQEKKGRPLLLRYVCRFLFLLLTNVRVMQSHFG